MNDELHCLVCCIPLTKETAHEFQLEEPMILCEKCCTGTYHGTPCNKNCNDSPSAFSGPAYSKSTVYNTSPCYGYCHSYQPLGLIDRIKYSWKYRGYK